MPFNLREAAGGAASRLTGGGPAAAVSNPVVAALIVTALAMAIFFTLLDGSTNVRECPRRVRLRCALYLFFGVSLVLSIHYYGMNRKMQDKYHAGEQEYIVDHIHGARSMPDHMQPDHVPVGRQSMFSPSRARAEDGPAPAPAEPAPAESAAEPAQGPGQPARQGPPAGAAWGAGEPARPAAPIGLEPLSFPLM